jgi:phosphoglycerate kinase
MKAALERGAKLVVAAHLASSPGAAAPSLEPIGSCLSGLLGHEVHLPDDCIGDAAKKVVHDLRPGQICLLENLHFHREEEENDDPAFAERLAELADVFVNDALRASVDAHASVHALARAMRESGAGLAMESALRALDRLLEPERPYVALLGGKNLEQTLALAGALIDKVDVLYLGGAVANTFLAARGVDLKASPVEHYKLAEVRTLLERARERGARIVLPEDVIIAHAQEAVDVSAIPEGAAVLDVGPKTAAHLAASLATARTILASGPLHASEQARPAGEWTEALSRALGFKLVLGQESASSIHLLEGKKLPGLEALRARGAPPKIVARSAETGDNPARRRS